MLRASRVMLFAIGLLILAGGTATAVGAEGLAPGQVLVGQTILVPDTRLPIELDEGVWAELRLEQREGAVDVALEGGSVGSLRVRTEAGRGGQLRVVLVGTAGAPWVLSLTPRGARATVDLRLSPAHATDPAAERRAAAFRDFVAAELLRREHYRELVVKTRTPQIDQQTRGLYASASEGYERAGDACGLRLSRIGEARMEVAAGGYARARALLESTLGIPCEDDLAEQAQAYKTIGMAAAYQGDFAQSAEAAEAALRLYRRTEDLFYQGVVLGNLSDVYLSMGETARALDSARGALDAAEASHDAPGVVYSRKGIAAIQLARGELAAALDTYRQTLVDLQKTPYPMIEGETWNDLGLLYHRMANDAESARAYARAQSVWTQIKHAFGTVDTTLNEAEALLDRGDRRQAATKFQQALTLAQHDGLKSPQVRAMRGLGAVSLAGREWQSARRSLTEARSLAVDIGERGAESLVVRALGDLEREEGHLTAARADYERALALARESADEDGAAATLGRLARVRADLGELDEARASIDAALEIVELQRGQISEPGLRTSFFSTARDFHDLRIQILMRLDGARPGQGFAAAALSAAEQARARALQDTLHERAIEIRRDVDPVLATTERAAQEALRVAAFRLARLPQGGNRTARDQVQRAVDDANRRLDEVRGQIRRANPRYAQLVLPGALAVEDIQATLLDDESVALEYWLGEPASYVWVVTRERVRVLRLPGRSSVERAVRAYRDALVEPSTVSVAAGGADTLAQRDRQMAQRLATASARVSRMVLGDALRGVRQRTLVVVADGVLQEIPFANLQGDGAADLVRTHDVVYLPSLSTLRGLRRQGASLSGPDRVALLAEPVFRAGTDVKSGLSRGSTTGGADLETTGRRTRAVDGSDSFDLSSLRPLPNSGAEARAIAALLPEERRWLALDYAATRQAVLDTDWRRFSVAHFAAHSLVDLQRPELSGIVLSLYDRQGRPQDGFLRLNDIYNLEMPVRLVVLSACDSAIGKTVGSEGAFSLARAFFYAGAPRVVASLWPIDDRATARFMELFYTALLVKEQPASAALRSAQLQMSREPRWRAPYYWAGFVVQGDWQ